MDNISKELASIFSEVKRNEPLAKYTTAKVGGKASWLVEATSARQIINAVSICRKKQTPYFVLGGGSNVIFSDNGFYGLIIRNKSQNWQILQQTTAGQKPVSIKPRFEQTDNLNISIEKLNPDDENNQTILVRTDSGIKISALMKALYAENIAGLQWFSGIPGTVGGAIYMNIHGGHYFFSDIIERATLLSEKIIKNVTNDYFRFDYDYSILHKTKEIVLQADLRLRKGDVEKAKQLAVNWAREKSFQPQKSAGCVFRNITREEQDQLKLPTSSSGYLIDKLLNLKGKQIGGAIISPHHAAFIENKSNARAADFFKLAQLVKQKAREKLDLNMELEIEFIGEF